MNKTCIPKETSSSSVSSSGDLVKHGYLYVKRPPGPKWNRWKAWHKRYFILKDGTDDHCPVLQMFLSQEQGLPTGPSGTPVQPQLSLDLVHVVHIGLIIEYHRFPNVLVIVCRGRTPLLLAAEDELAARSWMLAVGLIAQKGSIWRNNLLRAHETRSEIINCRTGQLTNKTCQDKVAVDYLEDLSPPFGFDWKESIFDGYSADRYDVEVHPTEASERKGLQGELHMVIFALAVGLAHKGETECFILWPVAFIRQYGHEALSTAGLIHKLRKTLVTLEVGRRCSTGEGVFKFSTTQGAEIILGIKRALALWSSQKCAGLAMWQTNNRSSIRSIRGNRWSGRSVPSTPSLPVRQPWHSCPCTPGKQAEFRSHLDTDDINYVTPIFERSPERSENQSLSSSPDLQDENCSTSNRDNLSEGNIKEHLPSRNRYNGKTQQKNLPNRASELWRSRGKSEEQDLLHDFREREGYIEVLPP